MAAPQNLNFKDAKNEIRRRKSRFMQRQRILRSNMNPFDKSEDEFRALYHFDRTTVRKLISDITRYIDSGDLPPLLRVCAALYYFYNGTFQPEYELLLHGAQFENVNLIASGFRRLSAAWIKFPQINEYDETKKVFKEKTTFPGVIGVLDNMHIRIVKPRDNKLAANYLNKGGFYSINLQLICDYNLKVLEVIRTFGGANKDFIIWNKSLINARLEQRFVVEYNHATWLLGSSRYTLSPWVIIPYRATNKQQEQTFNQIHENVRKCSSRLKSVLRENFRCLNYIVEASPDEAQNIVNSCIILHNMMVKNGLVQETHEISIYPDELDDDDACYQNQLGWKYKLGVWKRELAKIVYFQSMLFAENENINAMNNAVEESKK